MSDLQQEFVRVCGEGASPRVVEEGWAAVRGLLEQRDKLANLASCAQAQTAGGGHTRQRTALHPAPFGPSPHP